MKPLASRFAAAGIVALGAGCASAPPLPAALHAPAGARLTHVLHADGVQIYECAAARDGSFGWAFKAPEAELVDAKTRRPMGRHYAGPTWEAPDGSRVVGKLKARDDSPDRGAIPWLLLDAERVGDAGGQYAGVRSIQRLQTVGGKAPAGGCDSTSAARVARVPYQAIYRFYEVTQ